MAKARAYVFTLNNYTEEELENIKKLKYKYIIIGDEIGESGTPHLQGYINFSSSTSFNTVKKAIPKAHIESAKGTPRQNYEYCSKQQILFEDGDQPAPGKRKDIDAIKEYIESTSNPNMSDIIDNYATSLQSIRLGETLLKYKEKPRTTRPICIWYHGDTETGKTARAFNNYPNPYIKDNCLGGFFEGYDAHETIILDDMRADTFPWSDLLRLTDRYPNRVNVKNTSRQNLAKYIIVTSPQSPEQMFEGKVNENIYQLVRRFSEITLFTEKYVHPEN